MDILPVIAWPKKFAGVRFSGWPSWQLVVFCRKVFFGRFGGWISPPPHLKNMIVKLGSSSPKFSGWKCKIINISKHHLFFSEGMVGRGGKMSSPRYPETAHFCFGPKKSSILKVCNKRHSRVWSCNLELSSWSFRWWYYNRSSEQVRCLIFASRKCRDVSCFFLFGHLQWGKKTYTLPLFATQKKKHRNTWSMRMSLPFFCLPSNFGGPKFDHNRGHLGSRYS